MHIVNARESRWYWALPLALALLQLAFTLHARPQLGFEELAESVRNEYWLEHRTIYDGVSSNVGWYATLWTSYKLFGFSLHRARVVRWLLSLISLYALAGVLRKQFRPNRAWLPLLVLGLSPTLLYFNTLQTSYGIDLQYAPIVLYLVLTARLEPRPAAVAKHLLLGIVTMVAWMSYPTFGFYLPVFAALYLARIRRLARASPRPIPIWPATVAASSGFALPLLIAIVALKDPGLLINDRAVHSGLFRGAGFFRVSIRGGWLNLSGTMSDLFGHPNSYYVHLAGSEFSGPFAAAALGVVLMAAVLLALRVSDARATFALAFGFLALAWAGVLLVGDPTGMPGLRRGTPIVAALYALITIVWHVLPTLGPRLKAALTVAILVIAVHHMAVFPLNFRQLPVVDRDLRRKPDAFLSVTPDPAESLDHLLRDVAREDLELQCADPSRECRYAETFGAVAGSCAWNHLACHDIFALDRERGRFVRLDIKQWEDYEWPH
jgi:hypothetical protein